MGAGSSSPEETQAPRPGNPQYGATSTTRMSALEVNRTLIQGRGGAAGGTYTKIKPPASATVSPMWDWAKSFKGVMRLVTPILLYLTSLLVFTWQSFYHQRELVFGLAFCLCALYFMNLSVPKGSMHKGTTRYSATSGAVALLMGAVVGSYIHEGQVLMYYANFYGEKYNNVVPSQTADTFADATLITFEKEAYVMRGKSVGAQPVGDSHRYCVAPILAVGQENDVQFWAVGVDCCDFRNNFWCDGALDEQSAHAGVVVFDVGRLKTEADQYKAAIAIGEAENELRGAPSAILVRWVAQDKVGDVISGMLTDVWVALLTAAFIGSLPFLAGGVAASRALRFEQYTAA